MALFSRLRRLAVQPNMRYAKCPKCGHAPLPEDQALPAACSACGLVLAKYGTVPARPARPDADDDEPASKSVVAGYALYTPDKVSKWAWRARASALVSNPALTPSIASFMRASMSGRTNPSGLKRARIPRGNVCAVSCCSIGTK